MRNIDQAVIFEKIDFFNLISRKIDILTIYKVDLIKSLSEDRFFTRNERMHLFRLSLPVLFGYLPLGMAFGVLFVSELGLDWYWAVAFSLIVFAGSAQFLSVGLIANHAGLFEVFVAVFLLNSRHIFYGLTLLSSLKLKGWRKAYLVFALTDETFSLITGLPKESGLKQQDYWRLAGINQSYWVLGTVIGALLGAQLTIPDLGLEIVLPALFVVLAVEQYRTHRVAGLMFVAGLVGLIAIWLWQDQMLLLSISTALILMLMNYMRQRWTSHSI